MRYLAAVRFWLPKAQKHDILAELSEDIRSEVEERESVLGHPLTEAELEGILKQHGSPFRVASGYLPQRYLIGPAFFPVYALALKAIALFYLLPWLGAWIFMATFLPSYRAAHPGFALFGELKELWTIAFYGFALTTAAVALMERSAHGTGFADHWERKWNPRKLPAHDAYRIARGESIGEVLSGIGFALWWLRVFRLPVIPQLRLEFAPIISQVMYWPILGIALAATVLAAFNVFRPYWTKRRLMARTVIRALEIVQTVVLLSAGPLVLVSIESLPPAKLSILTRWINGSVQITILTIGIIALVEVGRSIWLLARRNRAAEAVAGTSAGPAAGTRAI